MQLPRPSQGNSRSIIARLERAFGRQPSRNIAAERRGKQPLTRIASALDPVGFAFEFLGTERAALEKVADLVRGKDACARAPPPRTPRIGLQAGYQVRPRATCPPSPRIIRHAVDHLVDKPLSLKAASNQRDKVLGPQPYCEPARINGAIRNVANFGYRKTPRPYLKA